MALVDINWNPSRKELRVFSLLLVAFGVIVAGALYQRLESDAPAITVLVITSAIGLLGIVLPNCVRLVYVVWMGLAFPVGWIVSHTMMLAVFFLVVTPIGLVMRMCGRDPMQRQINRKAKTYWITRSPQTDMKNYFRQF
jgi:Saxitoxin biosynthesis operon protein SxtJ